MEFKQIEAFVNVIKNKSFSKAADASFLTQPTISAHISALEKELGVTLIKRQGKESLPTKEGRAFYRYAINMINMREKAIADVGVSKAELSGVVDLRASSIPAEYVVPGLMSRFRESFPKVRFYMEESDSKTVWDSIKEGTGEIGFTGEFENNGLKYELLFREAPVLITPKNEKFTALRKKGDSLSPQQFLDCAFVWREEGSATRRTFEENLAASVPAEKEAQDENAHGGEKAEPCVAATVNSLQAVKKCVSCGLGVSVVSEIVVKDDGEKDYFVFKIDGMESAREFYMVTERDAAFSPAAAAFRSFVLRTFGR